MKTLAPILFLLSAIPWSHAQTAETIMDRYTSLVLGAHDLNDLQTLSMEGIIQLPQDMRGAFKMVYQAGGKFYNAIEVPAMGMSMTQACDGQDCWDSNPILGMRLYEGAEKVQALSAADLHRDLDWREAYASHLLLGEEEVRGKPTYKIQVVSTDGLEMTHYFEKDSGLLFRTDMTMENTLGRVETISYREAYRDVDGFLFPTKIIMQMMSHEMVMQVETMQVNQEVDATLFTVPEALQSTESEE